MTIEIAALPALRVTDFSPGSLGFIDTCRELFNQPAPLLRSESGVVAFRNEDLRQLAAHPEAGQSPPAVLSRRSFSAPDGHGGTVFGSALHHLLASQFFTSNPPIHKPLRQVLARHLMPKSVAALEPLARRIAREIIQEVPAQAPFDFTADFASRLTARFFGTLLGFERAEEERMVQLMSAIAPMFFFRKSAEELLAADGVAAEYTRLVIKAVHRTLAKGDNALVNTMAAELAQLNFADDPERAGVVPDSIGLMMASNLIDGFHTVAVAASSSVYMLLRHPREMDSVRAQPALARAVVFETLRLLSPLTMTQRYALGEMEYANVRIPQGTPLIMLWAVGNRDPQAFTDPDTFSLTRPRRNETTFGGGVHICPGRYAAGMLAEVVVTEVCAADVNISLAADRCEWFGRSVLCQLVAMPVNLSMQHISH
jgi:cytochrome P450